MASSVILTTGSLDRRFFFLVCGVGAGAGVQTGCNLSTWKAEPEDGKSRLGLFLSRELASHAAESLVPSSAGRKATRVCCLGSSGRQRQEYDFKLMLSYIVSLKPV